MSCSECGAVKCQDVYLPFSLQSLSLSSMFFTECFHDPITYSTLLVNVPGKLRVGRAVYCEVTLDDAVIVP